MMVASYSSFRRCSCCYDRLLGNVSARYPDFVHKIGGGGAYWCLIRWERMGLLFFPKIIIGSLLFLSSAISLHWLDGLSVISAMRSSKLAISPKHRRHFIARFRLIPVTLSMYPLLERPSVYTVAWVRDRAGALSKTVLHMYTVPH